MSDRFVHRIYATVLGYFWLPCPVCGRMFGGHEVTDNATYVPHPSQPGLKLIACPRHDKQP